MLHLEAIEPVTLELLKRLQALPAFAETRLVGGTALALQLGHRVSVDLDVFGKWDYAEDLQLELSGVGHAEKESGTPNGRMAFFYVDGVKVDCVAYDMYPWLEPPVEEGGVRLAGVKDKYPAANPALAMRSMSYFVDAETMPMPRMLVPFDWDEAKARICAAVRKLVMSAGGHRG